MNTGPTRIRLKKMEWAAGVVATPIFEMWKEKKAVVWLSGWTSQEDGPHLEHVYTKVYV